MKRVISPLLFALMFFSAAVAQNLNTKNDNNVFPFANANTFRYVSVAVDTLYYDDENLSASGFSNEIEEGGAYIKLPQSMLAKYDGKKIIKILCNVQYTFQLEKVFVRIYATNGASPTNYNSPNYEQEVLPFVLGWNNVELTTPFEIDGQKTLYVGYHIKGKHYDEFTSYQSFGCDNTMRAGSTSFQYTVEWIDFVYPFNLNIRAVVEKESDNTSICDKNSCEEEIVSVYPNPAKNIVNIGLDNVEKIEVYSLAGSKVAENYNQNNIDISLLQRGIYLVKVISNNKEFTKKLSIVN